MTLLDEFRPCKSSPSTVPAFSKPTKDCEVLGGEGATGCSYCGLITHPVCSSLQNPSVKPFTSDTHSFASPLSSSAAFAVYPNHQVLVDMQHRPTIQLSPRVDHDLLATHSGVDLLYTIGSASKPANHLRRHPLKCFTLYSFFKEATTG
jgi:hypothetical protein